MRKINLLLMFGLGVVLGGILVFALSDKIPETKEIPNNSIEQYTEKIFLPIGYAKIKWFYDKKEHKLEVYDAQDCLTHSEGGSMVPMIMPGNTVCYRAFAPSEIKPGQMVAYQSDEWGLVVHLVDAVYPSKRLIVTKAIGFGKDYERYSYENVPYDKIKGIVIAVLPTGGN